MPLFKKAQDRFPSVDSLPDQLLARVAERANTDVAPEDAPKRTKTRFLNFDFSAKPASGAGPEPAPTDTADGAALACLVVVQGNLEGRRYPINDLVTNIARHEARNIQIGLSDDSVSRESHASVTYYGEKNGFVIRDGLKPNPILLNGSIMRDERKLNAGDLIQIGQTILRFELG